MQLVLAIGLRRVMLGQHRQGYLLGLDKERNIRRFCDRLYMLNDAVKRALFNF